MKGRQAVYSMLSVPRSGPRQDEGMRAQLEEQGIGATVTATVSRRRRPFPYGCSWPPVSDARVTAGICERAFSTSPMLDTCCFKVATSAVWSRSSAVSRLSEAISAACAEIASLKQQTVRIADLENSRRALTAELVSLKAQVGRIAEFEQQASRVAVLLQSLAPPLASTIGTPGVAKGAEQPRK